MQIDDIWYELFTKEEIEEVSKHSPQDRRHLLQRVIFSESCGGTDQQTSKNTKQVIRRILDHDPDWIVRLKKRLLNNKDFTSSSSAAKFELLVHYSKVG